jgi:hypothetical protein
MSDLTTLRDWGRKRAALEHLDDSERARAGGGEGDTGTGRVGSRRALPDHPGAERPDRGEAMTVTIVETVGLESLEDDEPAHITCHCTGEVIAWCGERLDDVVLVDPFGVAG